MNTATSPSLDPRQAIGQIAVELPGATAVFRRLKLDFCCGGQVPLEQAAADAGQPLTLRLNPRYDHSYFFIASFIGEHIAWHAHRLS